VIFIGCDPGVHGGIAVIHPDEVRVHAIPGTDRELLMLLAGYRSVVDRAPGGFRPVAFAMLERVWGMPGWGARNFKFGQSYGALRMALAAQRIPFEEVLPQRWQKAMGIVYPKGPGRRDKNITKQRAAALFPQLTVTHAISDALLIAEFARRLHGVANGEKEGRKEAGGEEGQAGQGQARPAISDVAGHGEGAQSPARQSRGSDRGRSAADGERASR
jgi:hypothetical protein